MGKVCPLCDAQYNDKVKKCPKDHCPNCGTDKISKDYQYYPINIFLLNGASMDGVIFLIIYLIISVVSTFFSSRFLISYIEVPYNIVISTLFFVLLYFLVVLVYNTSREYESDNKPPRLQIGYKCNNCEYSFEFPDTMIMLVKENVLEPDNINDFK